MPKLTYAPTETDRLTGDNVRMLRRLAGETLVETIDRSGIDLRQSSLSRIELGQRRLSLPEATKLAAHFNTTVDKVIVTPKRPALQPVVRTEQQFLGNHEVEDLFADAPIIPSKPARNVVIDRDNPLTPDQYRADVWIPYLEARFATATKAA